MTEQDYSTNDLIILLQNEGFSEISIRNVRFYTDAELLDKPAHRGKEAVYSEEQVERLRLILRLRRRNFGLEEIKRIIAELKPGEAAQLREGQDEYLNRFLSGAGHDAKRAADRNAALDYIDEHLGKKPIMPIPIPPMESHGPPQKETWHRISLTPGIELHYRKGISPDEAKLVEKLVETANTLYTNQKGRTP